MRRKCGGAPRTRKTASPRAWRARRNPCFAGARITGCDVLEYFVGGMSEREIFDDFPAPRSENIRAAL
jgi:hypothetical protein